MQEHDLFTIVQRFTLLVNRFDLYDSNGKLIGFAEQKRFKLREQVSIWKTETRDKVLFSIRAENILDVHGKYIISDENDDLVGYLCKVFTKSLVRSTWEAFNANGVLLYRASEKNLLFALIRRVGTSIPILGEILEQLPIRFDLVYEGKVVGYHRRIFGIRDKYEIAITSDLSGSDKRILLALGIVLDVLQNR